MTRSSSITYMTEALREFIDRRDLEDLLGTVKPGRLKEVKEEGREHRGGSAWRRPVDFRIPVAPSGRSRAADGAVSFHLAFDSVSKSAGETGRAAGFDSYVTAHRSEGEAARSDVYVTALDLSNKQALASRADLLLSNIDPCRRGQFWKATEKGARTSGGDYVSLHPEAVDCETWTRAAAAIKAIAAIEAVEESYPVDDSSRRELLAGIERSRLRASLLERRSTALVRGAKPIKVSMDATSCLHWIELLTPILCTDPEKPAIRKPKPREGRVQERFVIEVPAEIDHDGRHALVRKIAARLDAAEVMYTIVLHRPDALNNQKNWHVHVLVYPRKCVWIESESDWDIALTAARRKELGIHLNPMPKNGFAGGSRGMTQLRHEVGGLINSELAAAAQLKRVDPRSYAAMGIPRKPAHHLGSAASALESAGVATQKGRLNAQLGWSYFLAQIEHDQVAREEHRQSLLARAEATLSSLILPPANLRIAELTDEYRNLLSMLGGRERELSHADVLDRIARSRAQMVSEKARQLLSSIDAGRASASLAKDRDRILARYNQACRHLDEIDRALEPWFDDVAATRHEVATLGDRIQTVGARLSDALLTAEADRDRAQGAARVEEAGREHAWESLRQRIIGDRLAVRRTASGDTAFEVEGITPEERSLMRLSSCASRASGFLEGVSAHQDLAIGRVIAAVKHHGLDAVIRATRGDGPLKDVGNLYSRYADDPRLIEGLNVAAPMAARPTRLTPPSPKVAKVSDGNLQGTVAPAAPVAIGSSDAAIVSKQSAAPAMNQGLTAGSILETNRELETGLKQAELEPIDRKDPAYRTSPVGQGSGADRHATGGRHGSAAEDRQSLGEARGADPIRTPGGAVASGVAASPQTARGAAVDADKASPVRPPAKRQPPIEIGNERSAPAEASPTQIRKDEEAWHGIVDRIEALNLDIVNDQTGKPTVPSLSDGDQAILASNAFAEKTRERLLEIRKRQVVAEALRKKAERESSRKSAKRSAVKTDVPVERAAGIDTGDDAHPFNPESDRLAGAAEVDNLVPKPDLGKNRDAAAVDRADKPRGSVAGERADPHPSPLVHKKLAAHFDRIIGDLGKAGHRFDKDFIVSLRSLLCADPPMIVVARGDGGWSAEPLPTATKPSLPLLRELTGSKAGRALQDDFMPHLAQRSPIIDRSAQPSPTLDENDLAAQAWLANGRQNAR